MLLATQGIIGGIIISCFLQDDQQGNLFKNIIEVFGVIAALLVIVQT